MGAVFRTGPISFKFGSESTSAVADYGLDPVFKVFIDVASDSDFKAIS